jgi:hypothetical protein
MMMRPVLEHKERSCGYYTPVPDALKLIGEMEGKQPEKDGGEDNAGCSGCGECEDGGTCGDEGCTCGSE